jgi:hypothetical protein
MFAVTQDPEDGELCVAAWMPPGPQRLQVTFANTLIKDVICWECDARLNCIRPGYRAMAAGTCVKGFTGSKIPSVTSFVRNIPPLVIEKRLSYPDFYLWVKDGEYYYYAYRGVANVYETGNICMRTEHMKQEFGSFQLEEAWKYFWNSTFNSDLYSADDEDDGDSGFIDHMKGGYGTGDECPTEIVASTTDERHIGLFFASYDCLSAGIADEDADYDFFAWITKMDDEGIELEIDNQQYYYNRETNLVTLVQAPQEAAISLQVNTSLLHLIEQRQFKLRGRFIFQNIELPYTYGPSYDIGSRMTYLQTPLVVPVFLPSEWSSLGQNYQTLRRYLDQYPEIHLELNRRGTDLTAAAYANLSYIRPGASLNLNGDVRMSDHQFWSAFRRAYAQLQAEIPEHLQLI